MVGHHAGALSVSVPTVHPMSINPWRLLAKLEEWELRWHDGGVMGRTLHSENAITMRRGMTWAERRCTIRHDAGVTKRARGMAACGG